MGVLSQHVSNHIKFTEMFRHLKHYSAEEYLVVVNAELGEILRHVFWQHRLQGKFFWMQGPIALMFNFYIKTKAVCRSLKKKGQSGFYHITPKIFDSAKHKNKYITYHCPLKPIGSRVTQTGRNSLLAPQEAEPMYAGLFIPSTLGWGCWVSTLIQPGVETNNQSWSDQEMGHQVVAIVNNKTDFISDIF